MFDDQPNAPSAAPSNLPVAPEDMFDSVEANENIPVSVMPNALKSGMLQKKSADSNFPEQTPPSHNQPLETAMGNPKGPILGKIFLFIGAALILGLVGFGGWWVYTTYFNGASREVPTQNNPDTTYTSPDEIVPLGPSNTTNATVPPLIGDGGEVATTTPAIVPSTTDQNSAILFGSPIDTDKDSLDDARERELGTDPNNSDTDGDHLNDGDEVIIWKTNPLKSDSDGDGHDDGKEVYNGYNPLGPGKLFNTSTTTPSNNGAL